MRSLRRTRTTLAIDMGRRLLRALEVTQGRGAVEVRRALCVEAPAGLDPEDAEAVGRWLREALDAAGIRSRGAVFAINRETASLKRLLLPSIHAEDLPDMMRLAMQRELGPAAEGAVFDFIPGAVEGQSTSVQAVAVPARELEYVRAMAAAAGLTVERVSLRTFGTALLLHTMRAPPAESSFQVALDLTGEGLELCAAEGGDVRHSRGAEVRYDRDAGAAAEAAITEARRSWTAWKLQQPDAPSAGATVMGEASVARRVVEGAADAFGTLELLERHPLVQGETAAIDWCWPLAGMLLEDALSRPRLDLASPRRAPDLGARRRMRGYAAAGLVVVAALTGWTLGSGEWRRMEERLQDLEEKARGALPEHQRFKRDRFRAMHLEAWQQGTPDWLEYAVELGGFAPDQSRIVFDQLSGALDPASARLVKEPQREPRMVVRRGVRINLEGEARDRTGVEGLRESLVRDSRLNLESIGSEKTGGRRLPIPFSFLLRQGDGENKGSAKPPAGASGGASGGASQGQAAPGGAANAAPAGSAAPRGGGS
ncbi:MAG: hypothetical protein U0574_12555 [Phycisphaerales bacterium]